MARFLRWLITWTGCAARHPWGHVHSSRPVSLAHQPRVSFCSFLLVLVWVVEPRRCWLPVFSFCWFYLIARTVSRSVEPRRGVVRTPFPSPIEITRAVTSLAVGALLVLRPRPGGGGQFRMGVTGVDEGAAVWPAPSGLRRSRPSLRAGAMFAPSGRVSWSPMMGLSSFVCVPR